MGSAIRWLKMIAARVALVGFGVVLALVALEASLRLAGPLLRPRLRSFNQAAPAATSGTIRILCVGDSHTFGLWVKPEESYPARLQTKLAQVSGRFMVLNGGVPGMNSSQVRETLPDLLDNFAPDVVLLMVGVADFWNRAEAPMWELRGWRWIVYGGWWDRSRVVKLARLIRFNLRARHVAPSAGVPVVQQYGSDWEIRGGGQEIRGTHLGFAFYPSNDVRLVRRILRRDLTVIATLAEARGVDLVLMTYAPETAMYSTVNEIYREFAAKTGLPLIDLGVRLREWSAPPGSETAFFPDFHPRPPGYKLIADVIAEALPRHLGPAPHDGNERSR